MNNYEFVAQWILDRGPTKGLRILDYGCGAGQIVSQLHNAGVCAFGCDVFYEGGDYSSSVDDDLFDKGFIKRMESDRIPYDSNSFDYVLSNQVMEHVPNIDSVLSEIQRVLKPGGVVLSLFPDKGVYREGHCGIAFLHWFPKRSQLRVYYAATFRGLGFGYHKGTKGVMQWSRDFCQWLDQWTYYRTLRRIHSAWSDHFTHIEHIEDIWLQKRLGRWAVMLVPVPRGAQKLVVRKLNGLIFTAHKA